MSLEGQSKRAVDSMKHELETEYGEFDLVEQTWEHPPERFEAVVERFERGTLGGAGVWLTNDDGEVLLVRNEGDVGWADPGGKVAAGESYEEAARREVREETGLECRLTGVCDVHVVENRAVATDSPSIFELIVIFTGEPTGGKLRPREGEIAELEWVSKPPETVLYEQVRTRPFPASE